MQDILKKAMEYRDLVAMRAIAHERSAEHHRARGVRLGLLATGLSAAVGSAVFITVTKQLGLDGQDKLPFPTGGWALLIYFIIGLFLILAPVLTGVHTYLNDPQQAEKHKVSWAAYCGLRYRLEFFLLRYADVNTVTAKREEALKELENISKEIQTVANNSLTLTDRAYATAATKLQADTIAATKLQTERTSNKLKEEIGWLKVVFGVLVATDIFLVAWLARNYATPEAVLVLSCGIAIFIVTVAIILINKKAYLKIKQFVTASEFKVRGTSNKLKEEIGWLKVVFGVLVATDIFLVAWLLQNYATPDSLLVLFYGVAVVIVTGAIVWINIIAYRKIDKLEEL